MRRIVYAVSSIHQSPLASNMGLSMPNRTLPALAAAALLGLIIGLVHAPAITMNLDIYPRLTDSEFGLLQANAESFAENLACHGVIMGKQDSIAHFFALSIRSDPILFVDNSGPEPTGRHHVCGCKRCNSAATLERWIGITRNTKDELKRAWEQLPSICVPIAPASTLS